MIQVFYILFWWRVKNDNSNVVMKIIVFVFVYKPKDENKKTFWLWVYWTTPYSEYLFWISKEVERKRWMDYNIIWAILWMEKALELWADEVEINCSSVSSVNNMTKPLSRTIQVMWWKVRKDFYKLKNSFRIAAIRYVREKMNKWWKKMAKIGAWEKIIFKWV